jgi:O-antigen ligase
LWAPQYLKDRILHPSDVEDITGGELDNASQMRIDTWTAVIKLVSNHPIDGVGFAGLEYVLPQTGEELGLEVKDTSHNTYLRFLGEMGIFGLGIFLVLLWKCWWVGVDAARIARSRFDRQLAIGFSGATLAMAVSCAFGDRFFSVVISGSYWIVCALVNDLLLERPGARA